MKTATMMLLVLLAGAVRLPAATTLPAATAGRVVTARMAWHCWQQIELPGFVAHEW